VGYIVGLVQTATRCAVGDSVASHWAETHCTEKNCSEMTCTKSGPTLLDYDFSTLSL